MIRNWRAAFGEPKLPFLYVQLANHGAVQRQPVEAPGWEGVREAQLMALSEPCTGMAVTIDIGDATDIHPRNKQDVGKRLALIALALVYGKPIEFSGPLYRSYRIEAGCVRLKFDHAAGGLRTSDGTAPKVQVFIDEFLARHIVVLRSILAGQDLDVIDLVDNLVGRRIGRAVHQV